MTLRPALNTTAMLLPRPHPPEWYELQQRLFQDAIKPITQMKMNVYSLYMPTIIIDSAGNVVSRAYPEEAQALIAELDKMIQQVADSWEK